MSGRRQFLSAVAATLGLTPVVVWFARPAATNDADSRKTFPVAKSDAEWKMLLSSEEYGVLRRGRTEFAYSSPLNKEKRAGIYVCAGCGQQLFSSDTKYNSGTGWPSFWSPLDNAVEVSIDRSWFMVRREVRCARCGGHLGHVFDDGPEPTGLRYCMNGVAMRFEPKL
jgi:peptide-methionine (R)-S-oxide reductase